MADELDPGRLDDLFDTGVDEVSWKKHHNYPTLIVDYDTNNVVWGAKRRDADPGRVLRRVRRGP